MERKAIRLSEADERVKNVRMIALSDDGLHLAAYSGDTVSVVELPAQRIVASVGDLRQVDAMAFSATGRYLALGTGDNELLITEALGGKSLLRFAFGGQVKILSFSRNGRLIASVGRDRIARVINLENGEEISRMAVARAEGVEFSLSDEPFHAIMIERGGAMRYDEREPLVAILESEDLKELMNGRPVRFSHVAEAIRLDPKINEERMRKAMKLFLENIDLKKSGR